MHVPWTSPQRLAAALGLTTSLAVGCASAPPPRAGAALAPPETPSGAATDAAPPGRLEPTIRVCGQDVRISAEALACNDLQFDDLRALAELTSLRHLDLSRTGVTDLSPLAGRTRLESLDLQSTDVTDLKPLATLTGLERLRLVYRTTATTAHPRVLTALARPTPKVDLGPLARLPALLRVELGFIAVDSLAPLAVPRGLRRLGLVAVEAPANALAALAGLTELERVGLSDAPCRNLEALSTSTRMTHLSVHRCRRVDLRHLAALTELRTLTLSAVEGRGARELSALTRVRELDLSESRLDDYTFIRHLTGVASADLSRSAVTDLTALASLSQLRFLDVSKTRVSRLMALEKLTGLERLRVSGVDSEAAAGPDPKLASAVARLERRLPKLRVEYDSGSSTVLPRTLSVFDDDAP